jgi:hypothetical protein
MKLKRPPPDVRFTRKSRHSLERQECPLCATSGLMHCGKAEHTSRKGQGDLTQCSNYTGACFSAVDLKEEHKLDFRCERHLVDHFDALSHAAWSQCG